MRGQANSPQKSQLIQIPEHKEEEEGEKEEAAVAYIEFTQGPGG